jgi:hypothetical protein
MLVKVLHTEGVLAGALFLSWLPQDGAIPLAVSHSGLMLPETEKLSGKVLILPTGTGMSPEQIESSVASSTGCQIWSEVREHLSELYPSCAKSIMSQQKNDVKIYGYASQWIYSGVKTWREWRHFYPRIRHDRQALIEARLRYEADYSDPNEDPLVSVVIGTWNRGQLMMERAVASTLEQTYKNFEIVIVGDCCTDDTEELIKQNDPESDFIIGPRGGPILKIL